MSNFSTDNVLNDLWDKKTKQRIIDDSRISLTKNAIGINVPSFDKWYSALNAPQLRKYNYTCVRYLYFIYYNNLEEYSKYKSVLEYFKTKTLLYKLRQCDKQKQQQAAKLENTTTSMDNINTPEFRKIEVLKILGLHEDNSTALDKLDDSLFE